VDKPAGIPVHPVNRVRENSLIRILRRQEGRENLRLVHRLDRETSGVLLVAEVRSPRDGSPARSSGPSATTTASRPGFSRLAIFTSTPA
jgi:hypothetical protein